ncbi:MAG: class I SAM-dependent methyltransferase [Planctomycetes bacterium]|nr:class I SAM-dependent methyltransferase [Planctomycetota bacterium]
MPSPPDTRPALDHILRRQLALTPSHERFLRKRLASADAQERIVLEEIAGVIVAMAGDGLDQCCLDYDWLTNSVLEEEMHFRRSGRYRLQTLQQAIDEVYSQPVLMTRYMNGLLMTQAWWSNHTRAILCYRRDFLAGARGRCLEIGPGHGLLLRLAAESAFDTVEALDISAASLELTKGGLRRAGLDPHSPRFRFHARDLFDPGIREEFSGAFDAIVFSEVLEHLDRPSEALQTLLAIMRPGGRLFIHVPVNSPAPDHLFLLESPAAARDFVAGFGFDVDVAHSFAGANLTLDRALATQSTISCVFVLTRPTA